MRRAGISAICIATLTGCATAPVDIPASYVSPVGYEALTCDQLNVEFLRVTNQEAIVAERQRKKASGDAVAMGVGLLVFWPSIFFIQGDDQTAGEVANLRGQQDTLQQVAHAKGCPTLGVSTTAPIVAASPAG